MKMKSLSRVQLFLTPWTAAYQAPPSMGFSRQEYWSGVPLPSPMTNLDSILKSRDITLPAELWFLQRYGFCSSHIQMGELGHEKDSAPKIDAFELWHWIRLLRVPWIARGSNQSILKEINPEYSLEELMLKLQYFGHLMQRANSLEKSLMLGKIEGRRRGR